MLQVKLTTVGKLKERYFKDAQSEYEKRLSKAIQLRICEIKEQEIYDETNPSYIKSALSKEAEKIKAEMDGYYNVALCVEGEGKSSEELADFLEKLPLEGYSKVNFIIGSSFGISDEVKKTANEKLSFSKMTFPHQLMRVILLEQLYRAVKINENTSYHK